MLHDAPDGSSILVFSQKARFSEMTTLSALEAFYILPGIPRVGRYSVSKHLAESERISEGLSESH